MNKIVIQGLKDAQEDLEIMFAQLEQRHDKTGYIDTHDFVGIDSNLDNVHAAIKNMKAAISAMEKSITATA